MHYDIILTQKTLQIPQLDSAIEKKYALPISWWENLRVYHLNATKEDLIKISRSIKDARGRYIAYPSNYATPAISLNEAKEKALAYYEEKLKEAPQRYGALIRGADTPLYFSFIAPDYIAQENGYVPGTIGFDIDKITGELTDKNLIRDYFALNS